MSCPYAFNRTGVIVYSIIFIFLFIFSLIGYVYKMDNVLTEDPRIDSSKVGYIVSYLLFIVTYACLLVGAYKRIRGWLVPYLILHVMSIFGMFIIIIYFCAIASIYAVLIILVISVFYILMWIGVYGHYKYLGYERPEPLDKV